MVSLLVLKSEHNEGLLSLNTIWLDNMKYNVGTPNGQPTTIWSERIAQYTVFLASRYSCEYKKWGRTQMSGIDTISITPDPEHLMGKWQKKKTSHTEAPWGSAQTQGRRRVFQMVRRRKPSSAEGTKGWRELEGYHFSLSLGPPSSAPPPPPRDFVLIFSASMFVFNGF